MLAATLTDAPVRRRAGQELADVWEVLRRQVEDRPADVRVTALVRTDRLDMFLRIQASQLTAEPQVAGEWARVELALPTAMAARALLAFGESVEVLSPPEAREELARAAAAVVELYGSDSGRPGTLPVGPVSPASGAGRGSPAAADGGPPS